MNPTEIHPATLRLLVRVYNRSIQSYYFFPDVILCGHFRLEREEFDLLLNNGFLNIARTDSFGKVYQLSANAEDYLRSAMRQRRQALHKARRFTYQTRLAFSDAPASN